jgi:hypothetical protein
MSTLHGRLNPEQYINTGKKWSNDEVSKLLIEIKEKNSIHNIANLHKRTKGAIISRLRVLAAAYFIDDSKTIPEIMEITGLPKEDIIDAISKREYYDEQKKKKIQKIEDEILSPNVTKQTNIKEYIKSKNNETSELQEILTILKSLEKRVTEYIKEKSIFGE